MVALPKSKTTGIGPVLFWLVVVTAVLVIPLNVRGDAVVGAVVRS